MHFNYQHLHQVLSKTYQSKRVNHWLSTGLLILIFLNILAIILESVSSIEIQYSHLFKKFEIFSVVIFSIEYLARLWACAGLTQYKHSTSAFKSRLRYLVTPMAIVDLLAILPFYLSFFFALDLRFLRILRLVRIFKLTRYSAAMKTLTSVLRDEIPALLAAYFIMVIVIILASSGIYLLEQKIQPNEFGSIPASMWWAVTTLTTVGYGDVTPLTNGGKLFGGLITLIGIAMVALPTGIIASGFGNSFRKKRQSYGLEVAEALADGVITNHEQEKLNDIRSSLGISTDDAQQIYKEAIFQHLQAKQVCCPNCGSLPKEA
ncbi:MAG: ion transporter [Cycloclasticus sp.]|nr:ion transporter [Cycloclasticus sp.]